MVTQHHILTKPTVILWRELLCGLLPDSSEALVANLCEAVSFKKHRRQMEVLLADAGLSFKLVNEVARDQFGHGFHPSENDRSKRRWWEKSVPDYRPAIGWLVLPPGSLRDNPLTTRTNDRFVRMSTSHTANRLLIMNRDVDLRTMSDGSRRSILGSVRGDVHELIALALPFFPKHQVSLASPTPSALALGAASSIACTEVSPFLYDNIQIDVHRA